MQRLLPLDRIALLLMMGLSLLIAILVALGDHTVPRIEDFSWEQQYIGAEDRAFIMTFNRPMNWEQVEANLSITPELKGKLSWTGRRLAYTLDAPVQYGQAYRLQLQNVEERQRGTAESPKAMQPFEATFRSRDLAFVYLGTNSEESGRLVLYRLDSAQKTILTPENLEVLDFKPFPDGDRVLFSATDLGSNPEGMLDPDLYLVSTGIGGERTDVTPSVEISQVLGRDQYQLLKFDLSPDGSRIVMQRALRSPNGALGEVSLWQMPIDGKPQELDSESGGDFQIAPDGQTLVQAQGQGLALISLDKASTAEPLNYLPEFGNLLSFSLDGSAAAVVKFNNDFTRSLFLVTSQGEQRELVRLKGGILSAQFDALKKRLYCSLTRVTQDTDNKEAYEEQPYLAVVDLESSELTPLLDLPIQPNLTMSLAPDASSILFDQVLETPADNLNDSALISVSNLWQLPLTSPNDQTSQQPIQLTSGATPKWLP